MISQTGYRQIRRLGLLLSLCFLLACTPSYIPVLTAELPDGGVHPFVLELQAGQTVGLILQDGTELFGHFVAIQDGELILEEVHFKKRSLLYVLGSESRFELNEINELWVSERSSPSSFAIGFWTGFVFWLGLAAL
jgi:hypothetical protein